MRTVVQTIEFTLYSDYLYTFDSYMTVYTVIPRKKITALLLTLAVHELLTLFFVFSSPIVEFIWRGKGEERAKGSEKEEEGRRE